MTSIGTVSAGAESEINAGLKASAGGVYVLPAGNHKVTDTIIVPENTIMQGEVSEDGKLLSRIELTENANLGHQIPVVRLGSNCKILYVDFFGNEGVQSKVPVRKGYRWGNGYHNFIGANYADNIEVAHCNFYSNLGDGLRATRCKGVSFHDNTAGKGGHDVLYAIRCENVEVYNNYVEPRVNSAFRFMDVNHGRIYNNVVVFKRYHDGEKQSAGPAIQIQNDDGVMRDIEVCGNYVYNSWGPGFWIVGKTTAHDQEVWIHHNVMYNPGTNSNIYWVGGVIASGYNNILLENNVFDGSYLGAVNFWAYSSGWATSATATVKNNILCDSVPNGLNGIGGWGINNEISKQHVVSEGNCYYNNKAGDTRGCDISNTDYHTNPRTEETLCEVKWNGEEWVIPGISPRALGNVEGIYDNMRDISDEELEQFEFANIFSILEMNFYSDMNLSLGMPKNYKTTDSCNVTVYNNSYMPQTRYYVKTDNYTSRVTYEYKNMTATHYLITGYSANGVSGYNNLDVWELPEGTSRLGSQFVIPEAINDNDSHVKITVYDTRNRATEIKNYYSVVHNEELKDAINPFAYLYAGIIILVSMAIFFNLKIICRKWRFMR